MPDALKSPSPTAPDPAPGRAAPSEAAPASPQPLRLYEPPEGAVAALAAPRTHLEGRVLLHLQGHGQLGRRLLHRHLGPAERRRRVRGTPGSDVRRAGGGRRRSGCASAPIVSPGRPSGRSPGPITVRGLDQSSTALESGFLIELSAGLGRRGRAESRA